MRRPLAAAILLALLVAQGGCGLLQEVEQLGPSEKPEAYEEAYVKWTRTDTIYRDFTLVLDAHVTYRSKEFQDAYLRRYARLYDVKETELARLLMAEESEAERELRFVLMAYTNKREWNDFAKVNSIWRIFLQNERGERLPVTEKRHLENRTEVSGFFLLGPWSEAYELVFDLEGAEARNFKADRLTLVLASVLGQAEFSWDVAVGSR